ncbi:phosphoribosyltransferase family protein [Parafilimonas sp.]|uniref:phosphoribosyltransferase family protein n=1 Tax=Parafilimonas sp. TaxID=1969739 RepID=UPI0039E304CD
MQNKTILTAEVSEEKVHRMALEVAENLSEDNAELVIIGIVGAGKFGMEGTGSLIAAKVAAHLKNYVSTPVKIISLHLDKQKPAVIALSEEMNFDDKNVLLVDDVSNSGKTLMYALKPFMQYHPKRIQILVLVERMHKQFPIKPDYVGYSIATAPDDYVQVEEANGNIAASIASGE